MEGDEAYEEMSLSRLRQLVSAIPGAQRRKRGPDGKLKEKSKDELVAIIRESRRAEGERVSGPGIAEVLQPLAEQVDCDSAVAASEAMHSEAPELSTEQQVRGSAPKVSEATRSKKGLDQDYDRMSVSALRQHLGGICGVSRRVQRDDGSWRERTKDELIAAIRASPSGGGEESVESGVTPSSASAEWPQPLAGSQAALMRSFVSSEEHRGAKSTGAPQAIADGPQEKTADEKKPLESWTKTELRRHASRVAGLTLRHASGKFKTNAQLISELRAVAARAQSRPLMAAFQAGIASTGLSVKDVPAAEGPSGKRIWGLRAARERERKAQPHAKEKTKQRMAQPHAKEATKRRKAQPHAKEKTKRRMALPENLDRDNLRKRARRSAKSCHGQEVCRGARGKDTLGHEGTWMAAARRIAEDEGRCQDPELLSPMPPSFG